MSETAAIIGTGRLGRSLAAALQKAGYDLKYIASAESKSAETTAQLTGAKIITPPYSVLDEAGLIFITVPDRVISEIARSLAGTIDDFTGRHILHCSGILTSEVLAPLREKGASTLSFHPLQTFPQEIDAGRFQDIYIALEGEDILFGQKVAQDLGGKPFRIKAENKALYHAAACTASNYLIALAAAAGDMMEAAGLDPESGIEILLPLIAGTVMSLKESGVEKGLTGPIARGDTPTVEKHLEALASLPELKHLYAILGLYLLNAAGPDDDNRREIRNLLSKPS